MIDHLIVLHINFQGVKAHISIGGWSGSQFFSSNVASAENRTAFVQTVTDLVTNYSLDGLDFDWEYPNKDGVGCNVRSTSDSANFLSFLQELRQHPVAAPGKLVLSAATSIVPFAGDDATGTPMTNVSAFADVLDWIEVMNYDVWGSWSTAVGPNAPLNDTCISDTTSSTSVTAAGSAVSALQAWTAAGFPASQIVLGVPSYGHSFFVSSTDAYATTPDAASSATNLTANPLLASYPSFVAASQPMGDAWSGAAGPDICGVQQLAGGTWDMWGLIDAGILNADGSPAAGMGFRFDTCSQTPYVYNPATQTMISYDDPQSFKAKGSFIKESNLRGFAMWEAGGDYHDALLDSISACSFLPGSPVMVLSMACLLIRSCFFERQSWRQNSEVRHH